MPEKKIDKISNYGVFLSKEKKQLNLFALKNNTSITILSSNHWEGLYVIYYLKIKKKSHIRLSEPRRSLHMK